MSDGDLLSSSFEVLTCDYSNVFRLQGNMCKFSYVGTHRIPMGTGIVYLFILQFKRVIFVCFGIGKSKAIPVTGRGGS
jgi:hypothetical protein